MSDPSDDRPVQPPELDPYAYLEPVDPEHDICAEVYRYGLEEPVRQFKDDVRAYTPLTVTGRDQQRFINPHLPGIELVIHPLGDVFDVVLYSWYCGEPDILSSFTQQYDLLQRQYWAGEEMVDVEDYAGII